MSVTVIKNWNDLASMDGAGGDWELGNDIDSESDGYEAHVKDPETEELANDGKGWKPLDSSGADLDGKGHIIDGLHIDRPNTNAVGLFAQDYGNVSDFGVTNAIVKGNDRVGILDGGGGMSINRCFTTGTVEGNDDIGGFLGNTYGYVADSYTVSAVIGNNKIGGFVGDGGMGSFHRCYAVSPTFTYNDFDIGGFMGYIDSGADPTVNHCYWDETTSGISECPSNAQAKTISDMKSQDTFEPEWDFDDVWMIDPAVNDGYPALRQFGQVVAAWAANNNQVIGAV